MFGVLFGPNADDASCNVRGARGCFGLEGVLPAAAGRRPKGTDANRGAAGKAAGRRAVGHQPAAPRTGGVRAVDGLVLAGLESVGEGGSRGAQGRTGHEAWAVDREKPTGCEAWTVDREKPTGRERWAVDREKPTGREAWAEGWERPDGGQPLAMDAGGRSRTRRPPARDTPDERQGKRRSQDLPPPQGPGGKKGPRQKPRPQIRL